MILRDTEDTRLRAAEVISKGGVIAFRTDTFYGLGVDPFNRDAVSNLKSLKGREDHKPILLLISDVNSVDRLIVSRSRLFDRLALAFWPGPLTIIGQAAPDLPVEITAGSGTVGLRLPADDDVGKLVQCCGGVLTATSANPSGSEPARSAAQTSDYFPTGVDLIIDGGEVSVTEPSTVVNATAESFQLIREGALSREEIERVVQF